MVARRGRRSACPRRAGRRSRRAPSPAGSAGRPRCAAGPSGRARGLPVRAYRRTGTAFWPARSWRSSLSGPPGSGQLGARARPSRPTTASSRIPDPRGLRRSLARRCGYRPSWHWQCCRPDRAGRSPLPPVHGGRLAPAAAVHEGREVAAGRVRGSPRALAALRWPSVITPTGSWSSGMPNASRTARVLLRGHAEEAGAQPGVGGGLQDQQPRHRGVHVPERHRPAGLVAVGPALVRLGVAVEVRRLAEHGRITTGAPHHPGQPAVRVVERRSAVAAQNRRTSVGTVEHQERPALAEARRSVRGSRWPARRSTTAGSTGSSP